MCGLLSYILCLRLHETVGVGVHGCFVVGTLTRRVEVLATGEGACTPPRAGTPLQTRESYMRTSFTILWAG